MKILLHIDPKTSVLAGVWLNVRGNPTSFYGDSIAMRTAGEDTVSSRNLAVPWDQYCERLSERTPSTSRWECVDALPKETPQQAFKRLLKP